LSALSIDMRLHAGRAPPSRTRQQFRAALQAIMDLPVAAAPLANPPAPVIAPPVQNIVLPVQQVPELPNVAVVVPRRLLNLDTEDAEDLRDLPCVPYTEPNVSGMTNLMLEK
jgi:hypothetical protein